MSTVDDSAVAGEVVGNLSINVEAHRRHAKDCGSPEVQIALLTKRLGVMSKHFERHIQDKHSQHGMLLLISRRKRLLSYLKNSSPDRYKSTLAALGLRK